MFESSNRLKRKKRFNSAFAGLHEWITEPVEQIVSYTSLIFSNRVECFGGKWRDSRRTISDGWSCLALGVNRVLCCDVGVLDEFVQCFDRGYSVDEAVPIR